MTVFLHNLSPSPLWSTTCSGTLHFILHTFLHPEPVFFYNSHNNNYCVEAYDTCMCSGAIGFLCRIISLMPSLNAVISYTESSSGLSGFRRRPFSVMWSITVHSNTLHCRTRWQRTSADARNRYTRFPAHNNNNNNRFI